MESSAFFGKKAKIVTGSACLAAEIAVFFLWFAAPGAAYWKKLPYSWHWFSVRGLSTEIAGVCADTFATYHLPVIFALTLIFTANAAGFISLRGIFRRFWNFLASPAALPVTRAQVICLCVFAAVVVLFAWQCDDAFHSHRMSANLVNGNGLVYSVGERVNGATCPLWTLLVAGIFALTGEMFYSSLALNITVSVAAVAILLWRVCPTPRRAVCATALLISCRAFISFTTSGLENGLLFFLFALFLSIFLRKIPIGETSNCCAGYSARDLFWMSLLCGLILTTRMDNALLCLPLLTFALFKRAPQLTFLRATLLAAAGMLPFVLWEIFATIYYGFPFPNTAYAKLSTNYPFSDYLKRGIWYFCDSLIQDAIVLAVPATLAFVCCRLRKLPPPVLCILAGILLYYIYLLRIGGDFMSGRHFSVPFFIAIFALFSTRFTAAALPKIRPRLVKVLGTVLVFQVVMGMFLVPSLAWLFLPRIHAFYEKTNTAAHLTSLKTRELMFRIWTARPICERTFYFPYSSLVLNAYSKFIKRQSPDRYISNFEKLRPKFATAGDKNEIKGEFLSESGGFYLWRFGKEKHFTDAFGLGDAFLARLQPVYKPQWIIGHVQHPCPTGYRASLRTGANHVEDPNLHRYLDALWAVIRSDKLLTRRRLELIWKFNTGQFDPLLRAWEAGPRKSEPPLDLNNRSI